MLKNLVINLIKGLLYILDKDHRQLNTISDDDVKKFTHEKSIDFISDFAPATKVFRTVPYSVWKIKTKNTKLLAADKHLVKTPSGLKWIKDLYPGDWICTRFGQEEITFVKDLKIKTHMFDLEIDSADHLYYSNDVLSHNTTTAAGYLLWYAMFNPDSTILIAAHKYSAAQEIMLKIRYAYELCPDHIRAGATSYNKGSIEFDNSSRIVSTTTTETTGRSMAITLLYLDEFAFVRNSVAKEFWSAIRPTLATGGSAIITSTPNSDEDQFAFLWKGAIKTEDEYGNTRKRGIGVNGFKAYTCDWREHPDRDEEWASEERAAIGDEKFLREHENKFLIFEETLIDSKILLNLEGVEPLKNTGQVRWYIDPKPGMIYTVALDPSLGTGGDPAAIQVFEANTTRQVAEWKHNKSPIPVQIRILADIVNTLSEKCKSTNSVYYSLENNTLGEAALVSLQEYGEENIAGILLNEPKRAGSVRTYRKGFTTTNKSKVAACAKLKQLVESGVMKVNSKSLVSELKHFVAFGVGYAAKPGETDDLVLATLTIIRMLQILKEWHTELANNMTNHHTDMIAPLPFISVRKPRYY